MTVNFQPPQKQIKLVETDEKKLPGSATPFFYNWLLQLWTLATFQISPVTANKVYSGPASGAAALPTFRALGTSDMPGLAGTVTITTAKLTAGGATGSMTFINGILTAQTPAT